MDRYFTLIKMTGEGNEITTIPENNEITFFYHKLNFLQNCQIIKNTSYKFNFLRILLIPVIPSRMNLQIKSELSVT